MADRPAKRLAPRQKFPRFDLTKLNVTAYLPHLHRPSARHLLLIALTLLGSGGQQLAADQPTRPPPPHTAQPTSPHPKESTPADKPTTAHLNSIIQQALDQGTRYLIEHQNENGSWGGPQRTKGLNIYAPAPGAHQAFQIATTSLALGGLLQADRPHPKSPHAIQQATNWLLQALPKLKRTEPGVLYNIWGHAYSLRALAALRRHEPTWTALPPATQTQITELAQTQIAQLNKLEDLNGGWGYLDFSFTSQRPSTQTTSFLTATVLVAMHDAQQHLHTTLDPQVIQRSLQAIHRQRTPDFAYLYSLGWRNAPRADINRPAGSLARSQACNLALRCYQDPQLTNDILRQWLDRLAQRDGWLAMTRKRPIPHEGPFRIAGYFYYYGHYYAAQCLEQLPPSTQRQLLPALAQCLLQKQERDGSWWDYPLYHYHQAYGTGYALAALARYHRLLGTSSAGHPCP